MTARRPLYTSSPTTYLLILRLPDPSPSPPRIIPGGVKYTWYYACMHVYVLRTNNNTKYKTDQETTQTRLDVWERLLCINFLRYRTGRHFRSEKHDPEMGQAPTSQARPRDTDHLRSSNMTARNLSYSGAYALQVW